VLKENNCTTGHITKIVALLGGEHTHERRLLRDVAFVVHVLGALGLEAVLVVIEVDQMAPTQRRLVLEEVLHLERHFAAAPATAVY